MNYISVEIHSSDVIGDIDTDDLREELQKRNAYEPSALQRIAEAFKLGQPERATELARSYVSEQLGVIL